MSLSGALPVLLKHLVPALEQARAELDRQQAAIQPKAQTTPLLDADDVAAILKCSRSQVSRLCSDETPDEKRLPHVWIGSRLMFVESVLLECLASRARQSMAGPVAAGSAVAEARDPCLLAAANTDAREAS